MPKKPKTYDFEEIMSLTDEQKRQVIPQLASVANQRLRELEKQGETRPRSSKRGNSSFFLFNNEAETESSLR